MWYLFLLQQSELTPEEQLLEKLRVKKLQEEADLELANDAFGKTIAFSDLKKSKLLVPFCIAKL